MSMLSQWLRKAELLLAPPLTRCLICGKNSKGSSPLPEVCSNCAVTIPWIQVPRCTTCGRHVGCPDCTRSNEPTPLICNRSAVAYNEVMRELIGQYKYRGNERYTLLLGLMLDRAYGLLKAEQERERQVQLKGQKRNTLFSYLGYKGEDTWRADLLVPVPVSGARLVERGFNQAERLGHVLSSCRGIPQLALLLRTHHTGKQSFKSRAERLSDMKHAFAIDPGMKDRFAGWLQTRLNPNAPLRIIIVDDIYTTGSTIRACAEPLQRLADECGVAVEIRSLTLARS
ncbi:ComF family protein [Paenibacillus agri]|uniref:ComF family protein n=1 Tax=Paenibacillus agri TaxID=2744309 RepID=A0A850EKK8_9BACL|nr:ComF family protein [Paenibacillus agri]NUU60916.1 ComF family protein [Paenibacillus agri]